jgi:hypothetical protein
VTVDDDAVRESGVRRSRRSDTVDDDAVRESGVRRSRRSDTVDDDAARRDVGAPPACGGERRT